MSNLRFVVNGNKVEVIDIDRGELFSIKASEVKEVIKGLQSVELPTCNDGHIGCTEWHTNWG